MQKPYSSEIPKKFPEEKTLYNAKEKNLIWLASLKGLSDKDRYYLSENINQYDDLNVFISDNLDIFNELDKQYYDKVLNSIKPEFFEEIFSFYENKGITCVTVISQNYPKMLLEIPDPPFCLFCKGDIALLNSECIAVVGTRHPSQYGEQVTFDFSKKLAEAGLTIVSGLAAGLDAIAHKGALAAEGKTIAVLGSGLGNIYPKLNLDLAQNIINKNGLIISEYTYNSKPEKFHFPQRNRIIAGLSKGALITEAPAQSGALITADYTINYSRNLYAVPNNIYSESSKGTNNLIKNFSTSFVISPSDILQDFNLQLSSDKIELSENETAVYALLKKEALHYDKLYDILSKIESFEIKKLTAILNTMEIKGLIIKHPGNIFSAC